MNQILVKNSNIILNILHNNLPTVFVKRYSYIDWCEYLIENQGDSSNTVEIDISLNDFLSINTIYAKNSKITLKFNRFCNYQFNDLAVILDNTLMLHKAVLYGEKPSDFDKRNELWGIKIKRLNIYTNNQSHYMNTEIMRIDDLCITNVDSRISLINLELPNLKSKKIVNIGTSYPEIKNKMADKWG